MKKKTTFQKFVFKKDFSGTFGNSNIEYKKGDGLWRVFAKNGTEMWQEPPSAKKGLVTFWIDEKDSKEIKKHLKKCKN